ncbi:MAG: hypothetical protein IJA86_08810 [Clostridia bacterium]|nr:hypothetical protein [Clostridia bacterium]
MRKIQIFLLCFLIFLMFVSCGFHGSTTKKGDAEDILGDILSSFRITDGNVYSNRPLSEYPLTDALLARMFPERGDTEDLFCVRSAAVYFSKRFCENEIIVFELYDISGRDKIVSLLQKRANKKENAVVLSDGVYVYLICTDRNAEISHYLKP